jgi:Skp family chaperone for outer membrane proteins
VKKMILIVTGVAVLAGGAYFGSRLFAQPPAGAPATQTPTGTRVAAINIGAVFNNYIRAKEFKDELEKALAPYKAKAKSKQDEMKLWHDESMKPTVDQKRKDECEGQLRRLKRELEDMNLEVNKLVLKKQEDNLVTLWREVNMGIDAVAKAYAFQVVLGYGDPMEKDDLMKFPNINRKMQAMDLGSTVPLYVHGSIDISTVVTQTLNDWVQKHRSAKQ